MQDLEFSHQSSYLAASQGAVETKVVPEGWAVIVTAQAS